MHVPGKLYSCISIQVLQSRKKITQQKKPLFEFTTEIAFLLSYYELVSGVINLRNFDD